MKILLINTYYYHRGGDCTYNFSLGETLKEKGHEVFFWGMNHPQNYEYEHSNYFVDYIDFVELNKKKNIMNGLNILKNNIYSKENQKKLQKFIDYIKPDIAHLSNIHLHITPSIIKTLKQNNIPSFWTMHDFKLICPNTHFLSNGVVCEKCKGGKFYNCTINKCKKDSFLASSVASLEAYTHKFINFKKDVYRFIAPSIFLKDKFIEFGWDENKISFLRNFLDKINSNYSFYEEDYIIYFGGLVPWKGIKTLVNAVKDININLKIVGEGDQRLELEEHAKTNNKIEFLGHRTGNELINLVKKSKFIVIPSEWYENCPYTIMEAMSYGKPVIGAKIGGIPELIKNNTGLLFESKNVSDLKDKINILINNKEMRMNFSKNAHKLALEEFSKEKYYNDLIKLYNESLEKGV